MALGTILGSVLGSVASAGAGALASKAFGGGGRSPSAGEINAPLQQFQPVDITAGGLTSNYNDGRLTVTPSTDRLALVNSLSNSFSNLSNELGVLRSQVAPGVSGLRASRLGEIENARQKAIGDLRENLARRRVLGSSFGQDAISRAEAEFGGARERVAAESFMQELEMTNQLLNQQFTADRSVFQTKLNELNLEADLATKLSTKATDALAESAKMQGLLNSKQAELAAKEAESKGTLYGKLFEPVQKSIGSGVTSLFSGQTSGPNLMGGIWPA